MKNYNYSPFARNKFWFDNATQNPEEEDNSYLQLQQAHNQIIEQYNAQKRAEQEEKELQKALEKEVEKQLDKALEKALNELFKDFKL